MKRKGTFKIQRVFLGILFFSLLPACSSNMNSEAEAKLARDSGTLDIKYVSVDLPESKGLKLVQSNCVPCHSLRYIEMQPKLPRKAWDKIVKKMVKNFGAPISDTIVMNEIVDYLVAMK